MNVFTICQYHYWFHSYNLNEEDYYIIIGRHIHLFRFQQTNRYVTPLTRSMVLMSSSLLIINHIVSVCLYVVSVLDDDECQQTLGGFGVSDLATFYVTLHLSKST
jgi:hypothetical protein